MWRRKEWSLPELSETDNDDPPPAVPLGELQANVLLLLYSTLAV